MIGDLRRAALAVQGGGASGEVLADGEPCVARDVAGLLARLGDAAAGEKLDVGVAEPAALDEFLQ